jgi:hypothetical protein
MIASHLLPSSRKHLLFELNIGQLLKQAVNGGAGTWYFNLDAVYPLIEATLSVGLVALDIISVGSVSSDSATLLALTNSLAVQATELSFWFDTATRNVWFHLQSGDEPSLHDVIVGATYGVAKHDGVWGGVHFEGRLLSAPTISKNKDPLFWNKIAFSGGTYVIDNKPAPGQPNGPFDEIGELNYVFGSYARALVGFDDDAYGDFIQADYGLVDTIDVGPEQMVVKLKDPRSAFSKKLPEQVFDQTTYPFLSNDNVGRGIPVGYGVMRQVPVVCTNEEEVAPGSHSFKICDTSHHIGIKAITTVTVEHGGAKTVRVPATTDLINGVFTFTVASGFYAKGDKVTVDYSGYTDDGGVLIENALDVVKDILVTWLGVPFISEAFDIARWNAVAATCPAVGIFAEDPTEAIKLIESCVSSARVGFIPGDDGRLTVNRYNKLRPPQQVFTQAMLKEIPVTSYDPSEVVVSTMIGYNRNWSTGDCQYLFDDSKYDEIYAKYHNNKNDKKPFDTVLTNAADAQAFSDDVLDIGGEASKLFPATMKMQPLLREVMDVIQIPVRRRNGAAIIGDVVAEVVGRGKNLMAAEITLRCRVMRKIPHTVFVQGGYYADEDYYGDVGVGGDGGVYESSTYQEVV